MEPLVAVQHCLLVRQGNIIRPSEPGTSWWQPSDPVEQAYRLDGVSYQYWVPADTEFPKYAKPPWAVYLRITGWNAGATRVFFRIHHRDERNQWKCMFEREMDRAVPLPEADEETHEVVLNLPYIYLGGVGLHAIIVHFWYDGVALDEPSHEVGKWTTDPEELFSTPDWAFGAVDYFWVRKPIARPS